jgi:hypothetical protein
MIKNFTPTLRQIEDVLLSLNLGSASERSQVIWGILRVVSLEELTTNDLRNVIPRKRQAQTTINRLQMLAVEKGDLIVSSFGLIYKVVRYDPNSDADAALELYCMYLPKTRKTITGFSAQVMQTCFRPHKETLTRNKDKAHAKAEED